ncbi:response regulator [Azospirillum sp. RWY-5-1]|uniref:Response regulator n=1 Tax=Azospirillum oleiclasticum TaxID=2735135 RepID=A0ABX2TEL0_9PROT|nr:response regulator [Azospirillum oleiclasticum]NYZ14789.1 response regulator [Azospirillum oleiclasticum]NYZ22225.1 response regulator [Azospirillum oleiclasticum]
MPAGWDGTREEVPEATSAGPDVPGITACHILVVDDTEFNRTLIGALLGEAGFNDLAFARDGFDALEQIARRTPDLVILDIMMPGMDGFEVCRRLRADHAYADLPVLVQTALSSTEDRNKAFAVGTTDLIAKPIDRMELLARVRIHLENRVLIRDLRHYRMRVEAEFAIAASMYDHLLPSAAALERLRRHSGLRVCCHARLAADLGGSLWGALPLDGGRLGVYLVETPGRGVPAALAAFRMHTLIHELAGMAGTPATFLAELNRRAADLPDADGVTGLLYGVVDPAARSFSYVSAAGTSPLVVTAGGGLLLFGDGGGAPVGRGDGGARPDHRLPFPEGATLVLPSEALTRTVAPEHLGTLVRRSMLHETPFAAVVHGLDQTLRDVPDDDHSLVWIGQDPT